MSEPNDIRPTDEMGVDRDGRVVATRHKIGMPDCPKCGSNTQVWVNQVDHRLTCHRVGCQGAGGLSLGADNFPGDQFEECDSDTGTAFFQNRWYRLKRVPFDPRKADKRPQRFAWAPGSYLCKCCHCEGRFVGDKRAVCCAPCAYNDAGLLELSEQLASEVHAVQELMSANQRANAIIGQQADELLAWRNRNNKSEGALEEAQRQLATVEHDARQMGLKLVGAENDVARLRAALVFERDALRMVRDRQDGRASRKDLTEGIALINQALGNEPKSADIWARAAEQCRTRTCVKVPHTGTGYLHDEDDDSPYDVDGVRYCGRCHRALNWLP